MATGTDLMLRQQLVDRRHQLERAIAAGQATVQVGRLIHEVDAALARMDDGTYGLCEVCREPIESERLLNDPLARFCLDHLTAPQRQALESDLGLAASIQKGLLPRSPLVHKGWEAAFHYEPASIVSGDYCDLIPTPGGDLFFALGDVTGKGVAASLLMVHLQAMFRSLIPMGLALAELVAQASRVFCQSTLPTHFATLVCGRAGAAGELEICNAGHLPPLLVTARKVEELAPTGLPLGAFCDELFATSHARLEPGQSILLYTDGLTEARDGSGAMYGSDRVRELAWTLGGKPPGQMIGRCLEDLAAFRREVPAADDLTILAIRHEPGPPASSH